MSQTNTPQKRTYWKRVGYCGRCGRCCKGRPLLESIVEDPNIEEKFKTELRSAIKIFSADIDHMNCPDCTVRNGYAVCNKYKDRPDFCKQYPAVPGDLIAGCGFSFVEEKC